MTQFTPKADKDLEQLGGDPPPLHHRSKDKALQCRAFFFAPMTFLAKARRRAAREGLHAIAAARDACLGPDGRPSDPRHAVRTAGLHDELPQSALAWLNAMQSPVTNLQNNAIRTVLI